MGELGKGLIKGLQEAVIAEQEKKIESLSRELAEAKGEIVRINCERREGWYFHKAAIENKVDYENKLFLTVRSIKFAMNYLESCGYDKPQDPSNYILEKAMYQDFKNTIEAVGE